MITIIVLLILAGVTIVSLTGENGILTKAETVNERTQIGEEKEIIAISVSTLKSQLKDIITAEDLKNEMDKGALKPKKVEDANDEKNNLIVTYDESRNNRKYKVSQTGIIINYEKSKDEILEEKLKNMGDNVAIDKDGNEVALSLWNIAYNDENNTCSIEARDWGDIGKFPGYLGEIDKGQLKGNIPVFVKKDNKIYKLNSLEDNTFERLDTLISIEIPYNITYIGRI